MTIVFGMAGVMFVIALFVVLKKGNRRSFRILELEQIPREAGKLQRLINEANYQRRRAMRRKLMYGAAAILVLGGFFYTKAQTDKALAAGMTEAGMVQTAQRHPNGADYIAVSAGAVLLYSTWGIVKRRKAARVVPVVAAEGA
jgi:hypothetical protein